MTVPTDDDLLSYARYLAGKNPYSLKVFLSTTEKDFIEGVENALEHEVVLLEGCRREYDKLGEIGLSRTMATNLNEAGIPSRSEEYENGHVDLKIEHSQGHPFLYLCECKIWQSVPYHLRGMKQLLKDYASGRHRRGCCLEFVRIADTAGKLKAIRTHLDGKKPLQQTGTSKDHDTIKGGFLTEHKHVSGWDVEVLHFGCNLHQPL